MRYRAILPWWSWLTLAIVCLILIAYFFNGGLHGLYADDYPYKYSAYDLASSRWSPTWNWSGARTLNYLLVPNLANTLPAYELPARIGIVALQLINVVLLAALAYRLTASRWIAVLCGAFFFAPVFAESAVLWFTGAVIYLPSLLLMLAGMHLVLSCRSANAQFLFVIGAIAAWCAMLSFIESGFFVLLIVPALVWAQTGRPNTRPAFVAVGLIYLIFIPYALLVLRTAPVVALHGQTTFDPLYILGTRIPETLDSLVAHALDWQPGGTLAEALNLGLRQWLSAGAGWSLLALALLGMLLSIISFPVNEARPAISLAGPGARLLLVGLAWMGLALVPVLFIVGLPLTSSVLLFPSAGFALALAGLLGWLVERLGPWRALAERACLLLAGGSVLFSSLAMAGLVGVYEMRWGHDRQELAGLRAAVANMPDSPVWVAPVALDEGGANVYFGRRSILDPYLYGLFQIPWAAAPALKMEYGVEQIRVINEDAHGGVHLMGLRYAEDGAIAGLSFQGIAQAQAVPVGQLLAFTYRGGRVILFDHMSVTMPDGAKSELDLPLAGELAQSQVPFRTWNIKLEGEKP